MLFLKYGRDDENQADQLGVDYATKAGYDPREIPGTYQMLGRISDKAGQRLPSYLSTHPDPGDRFTRTTALAQTAAAGKTNLIVRQQSYVKRLDGIVFGVDPRQGYFQGTRFFHPELKLEITFPSGWKVANTREAVLAGEPNNQGSMQLTLAQAGELSPAAFVAELQRAGRITEARGGEETIGGWPAWVGVLVAPRQDGSSIQLFAAFIRRQKDQMFQILGAAAQGSGLESKMAESARSMKPLTDPARLDVSPDRLQVATVKETGTFEALVARRKDLAIDLDDTSILNNVQPGDEVRRGEIVKVIVMGKH
jgi:predicted Zn-dependent protease